MSKAQYETVKALIDKGQYDQARAILRGIEERQARVWETKINRLASQPHTVRNISIIVLFILLSAALVAYAVLYTQSNQNAAATSTAIQELQNIITPTVHSQHNAPNVNSEPARTPELSR
ncbi:MAG: hypothetical protein ABI970_22240 [Chloroflexota bacterium]